MSLKLVGGNGINLKSQLEAGECFNISLFTRNGCLVPVRSDCILQLIHCFLDQFGVHIFAVVQVNFQFALKLYKIKFSRVIILYHQKVVGVWIQLLFAYACVTVRRDAMVEVAYTN
jgi:hypothetical protein